MDKCPYCGADTRPGDNFCLNCGNRLLTATPSSNQQAPTVMSESTLAAPDDWGGAVPSSATTIGWAEGTNSAQTVADSAEPEPAVGSYEPTVRESAQSTMQAVADRIENPAHFTLRAENGDILQEYPLDKFEITIGRAPNSDILLSKDKLTSRRHATVRYENNQYLLYDEHSANGTLVNGQQMEDSAPHVLVEADHVGIGEHDLVFHSMHDSMADLPTISVPQELTYRTRADALATYVSQDEFGTSANEHAEEPVAAPVVPVTPVPPEAAEPIVAAYSSIPESSVVVPPAEPVASPPKPVSTPVNNTPVADKTTIGMPASSSRFEVGVNFNRLTDLPSPALPDISALMAALSTLDGQVMSLQEQINSSQEAMRNHEAEIVLATNQLRSGIRNVSDRMDSTIADVARSREALAWAELLQLMEDVMNNPRDIEYVTKLARKARELNKVFQIHQNVLNTMAECNSLLRSMIGENK